MFGVYTPMTALSPQFTGIYRTRFEDSNGGELRHHAANQKRIMLEMAAKNLPGYQANIGIPLPRSVYENVDTRTNPELHNAALEYLVETRSGQAPNDVVTTLFTDDAEGKHIGSTIKRHDELTQAAEFDTLVDVFEGEKTPEDEVKPFEDAAHWAWYNLFRELSDTLMQAPVLVVKQLAQAAADSDVQMEASLDKNGQRTVLGQFELPADVFEIR